MHEPFRLFSGALLERVFLRTRDCMRIFLQPTLSALFEQASRKRWLCVVVAILSLQLSGCATNGGDSFGSSVMNAPYDWRTSNDPIGALLARQKGSTPKNYKDIRIDHPLAAQAMSHLGISYRYGGKSPDTGFDCSGLVLYSAQQSLGLKLPPRADDQAQLGNYVRREDLKVGDLVFFNTMGRRYSHVGVYIGDDLFVHSPAKGGVVRVENMNMRYWDKRYTGARRLDLADASSK